MEEASARILRLSDLLTGGLHVTGVSSISPKNPASDFDWKLYEQPPNPVVSSSSSRKNTNLKILEPLKNPTVLIGTVSLPAHPRNNYPSSHIACSCFQFSDGSATVCCDILNFHPRIVGRNVRVCAWNFIPSNSGGRVSGFLEIISWEILGVSLNSDSFPLALDSCGDGIADSKAKYALFGVLESISPLTVVPCSVGESSSVSSTRKLCGFLVKILVCECALCQSRKNVVVMEYLAEGNHKYHCFMKPLIVYFCGSASSWHPAIVRLIGSMVTLCGLWRKLVYIVKDTSELMYVTNEKSLLRVPKVIKKGLSSQKPKLRGSGEVGSYVGTITGVYMEGMVVELDQELQLLLTDPQLMVPHSLRVGAILSVRNVHFVNPKFGWTKTVVLGACVITCISVESFSPFETGAYKRSLSQDLLWRFIYSLAFSARLWVLLTVACFQKKFAGILSKEEILGSEHKVGLVQTYATSCLPASAYQKRYGLFMEYSKHSLSNRVEDEDYSLMKLAVPVSYFRSYVAIRWTEGIRGQEDDFNVMSKLAQRNYLSCGGGSYTMLTRRIFQSEETAVSLLGYIKVSPASGRLQLVDASCSIDVVIPDIPLNWDFNKVYEVKEFKVIIQGISAELNDLDLFPCEPFSCRNIFEDGSPKRDIDISVFLYHRFRDANSIIYPSRINYSKASFQQLQGGHYHLFWLKHKFPLLHKSVGHQAFSNRSRAFAEAVILPWDLILPKKDEIASLKGLQLEEHGVWECEKHIPKRCKSEKLSSHRKRGSCDYGNLKCGCLNDSYWNRCFTEKNPGDQSFKFPCVVSSRDFKCPCPGFVYCTDRKAVTSSSLKPDGRSLLLEFDSESLDMHQGLRIGAYYIIKDRRNHFPFTAKNDKNNIPAAMLVNCQTYLRSISLSSDVILENSNSSSVFSSATSHEPEPVPDAFPQNEILANKQYSIWPESCCSDIILSLPSDAIHHLKVDTNVFESGVQKSSLIFETYTEKYDAKGSIVTGPLPSGAYPSEPLLPEGDLLSLHGLVVAIHDFNGSPHISHPRHEISFDAHELKFSPGASCIHVLVDDQMAMIFGSLSNSTYSTGLGPGVNATFHRILALSGVNQYMLLSASFIVLDSANVADCQVADEGDSIPVSLVSQCATSPSVVPATLISEITKAMDFKPMQHHVRVISIYVLVLQKMEKAGYCNKKIQFCSSKAEIPLVGFIVDDGSSVCCCWADNARAANFLGLPIESVSSEDDGRTSSGAGLVRQKANDFSVGHLDTMLRQHHRVIVQNQGSMWDSSCMELTVSVGSKEPVNGSHENFLRRLIINACSGNLWTVDGSLMDTTALNRLEKRLSKLEMKLLPLQNIWATGVQRCDPLAESRTIAALPIFC
ncbi:OLC1v1017797C1 [Oldenlandia corymbosa var. corymbosa]|uniref:CST complex subunit CTC1 n=1 Tax=Oldenlandia corymbosa var. corymbosa TaxID=529605 RepID=A0AAV1EA74_OLDCO|nr:OLC1v1017797C1 [Oldenlandia corymbosa var. corymbosa]